MSGITVQQCISLILQHIGGIPLQGAQSVRIEFMPVAKQVGFGGFSIPGLEAMGDALGGLSADSITGGLFENPLSTVTSAITDNIPTTVTDLASLAGTLNPVTGISTGGIMSLADVNELTTALNGTSFTDQLNVGTGLWERVSSGDVTGSLLGSLPSFSDLTDKISGVKAPDFLSGDFGLPQALSITNAFDAIKSAIPADLNTLAGDVTSQITEQTGALLAPLNQGDVLSTVQDRISSMVSELQAASIAGTLAATQSDILSHINSTTSAVTDSVTNSKEAFNRFTTASSVSSNIDYVSSTLMGTSDTSKDLINRVTKSTVIDQINMSITDAGYEIAP